MIKRATLKLTLDSCDLPPNHRNRKEKEKSSCGKFSVLMIHDNTSTHSANTDGTHKSLKSDELIRKRKIILFLSLYHYRVDSAWMVSTRQQGKGWWVQRKAISFRSITRIFLYFRGHHHLHIPSANNKTSCYCVRSKAKYLKTKTLFKRDKQELRLVAAFRPRYARWERVKRPSRNW